MVCQFGSAAVVSPSAAVGCCRTSDNPIGGRYRRSVIDDESGETIEFAIDGVGYSVDLKAKNANDFTRNSVTTSGTRREAVAAQRMPHPAAASTAAGGSGNRDPEQTRVIRQWAFNQDYEISERGRIPVDIEETYTAAH